MVLKLGAWFELHGSESYVYARIGRREVLQTRQQPAWSTAVRNGRGR
jgi:hypothetical protein